MNKTLIVARGTVKVIVGFGTASLLKKIAVNNMDEDPKVTDKVSIGLASIVIAGIIGEHTDRYLDNTFAKLSELFDKNSSSTDTPTP